MMKKYIILLILLITCLASCDVEDMLDIPQQGVLSVDLYKTADDKQLAQFISSIYYRIYGDYYISTIASSMSIRSNLGKMGGDFGDYFTYTENADADIYTEMWSYYYSTIYRCNMIIFNVPENNVASPEVITQIVSEARTIRAIFMMYLVQLWGTPPLADHIIVGNEGNTPAADSWAFIEIELAEAAEGLPSKDGTEGQAKIGGRLTKEAAFAYLGKAYLWQGKYSEATSTLYNKVIATGLYGLVDDPSELNYYTSDFCKEYLWETDIVNDPVYATYQGGFFFNIFNWSNTGINFPDQVWSGQGWGKTAYPSVSFGEFMDEHDLLSNRIKSSRYSATLCTYEDLLDPNLFFYSSGEKGIKGNGMEFCEGYLRLKLIPRPENMMGEGNWYNQYLHNNMCHMRYAEVLLNYAEAVAMGGSPSAMSGIEALNLVRNRAGLPDAPSLDMDNSEYGIKAERRAELWFEGSRFIDLIRWGDAGSVLANIGDYKPVFFGYIDGNHTTQQSKENWKIVYNDILSEDFREDKHVLFPIPSSDANNNPNLVQNPGW